MLKKFAGFIFSALALFFAVSLCLSNFAVETTEYAVSDAKLPASFDGYRIAQISDLHGRPLNDGIIRAVRSARPHAIVITGDLIDDEGRWASVSALLARLVKAAPVYYVTGNHEWADLDTEGLLEKLAALGVRALRNEYVRLTVGAESLILAGIDDPNGYADMKTPAELAAEIKAAEGDAYTILLSHRPDGFRSYAALGFDLTLSGHIHGGIIRLPLVGGLFSPGMELFPEYSGGVYRENVEGRGTAALIVSRGLSGAVGIPRLFNRPDIPVITLHKGQ